MSRKTHTEIYPQPLTLPAISIMDQNKSIRAAVQTFSDTGDGRDGNLVVDGINVVVNKYAGLIANVPVGTVELPVDNASDFSIGDEILIIQIQDFSGGELGAYEFAKITNIIGNLIYVQDGVFRDYISNTVTIVQQATRAQIVKIPQYNNVDVPQNMSLGADAWNGAKGGILAFKVFGTLSGFGELTVEGKGYRGGNASVVNRGSAGEGHKGYGPQQVDNYGGGRSVDQQGNNGGGSHATAGYANSYIYGNADLRLSLTFGGGGGYVRDYGNGGPGGGILAVWANNITFTGLFNAKGGHVSLQYGQISGAGGSLLISEFDYPTANVSAAGQGGGGNGYYLNTAVALPPRTRYVLMEDPTPSSPARVDIPNTQAGVSYTFQLTDKDTTVYMVSDLANTLHIPTNAVINFDLNQILNASSEGLGVTRVQAPADITLNGIDGGGCDIMSNYCIIQLIQRAIDVWSICGDISEVSA